MENVEDFSKGEEIANAILHGIGVGLSIAALVILIVFASLKGDAWHVVSFSIFGATLVMLYLSSTLLHSLPKGKGKDVFEILDHASIYLLIAGTYTPFLLVPLRGALGWTLFGIVWSLAVLGIIMKAFWVKKYVLFSTGVYVGMGWLIIFAVPTLLKVLTFKSVIFLVVGGVVYTLGSLFYVWRKIKFHHAIWHLFVLGGSICHFFSVLFILPK